MATEIAENMSQRWRMLFRRPIGVGPVAAGIEEPMKPAFEATGRDLDEAGTKRALKTNLMERQGRVTAMNFRHEAAKRSRDWIASG